MSKAGLKVRLGRNINSLIALVKLLASFGEVSFHQI